MPKYKPNRVSPEIAKRYIVGRRLGVGGFGTVYLLEDRKTGAQFALKKVENGNASIVDEVEVMLQLSHVRIHLRMHYLMFRNPNIVTLYEHSVAFNHTFLIMDYMKGGGLNERISKLGFLCGKTSKLFFYQICSAVNYMHAKGILHRDLKPDNILLVSENCETLLKLIDFGLCLDERKFYINSSSDTGIFYAPEVLQNFGPYEKSSDIWSLGAVLYECLSGKPAFTLLPKVFVGSYEFEGALWDAVSETVNNLIRSMLDLEPKNRPQIIDVLASDWVNDESTKQTILHLIDKFS